MKLSGLYVEGLRQRSSLSRYDAITVCGLPELHVSSFHRGETLHSMSIQKSFPLRDLWERSEDR